MTRSRRTARFTHAVSGGRVSPKLALASRTRASRRDAATAAHAFTLVELLVVLAIIGALVALLLPAVQRARESARRAHCQNNLRQLGVALTHYEAMRRSFPVGCVGCSLGVDPTRRFFTSWYARILPLIEQKALGDAYRFDVPSYKSPNLELARTVLPTLLCPSTLEHDLFSSDGPWKTEAFADYGGLYGVEGAGHDAEPEESQVQVLAEKWQGVLIYEEAVLARQVSDGLSQTAAVGEALIRRDSNRDPMEWADGHNLFAHTADNAVNGLAGLGNEIGSPHPSGASLTFCDGHVAFVSDDVPAEVVGALLTRAGGEAP